MTINARLAAAQTARAAARAAFNAAVRAAIDAAVARGLRTHDAIDAAVEADPAVIAARAASAVAIAELEAAEAAATAEERLDLVGHGARAWASSMVEGPSTPAVRDHDEDSCIATGGGATDAAPAEPLPAALGTPAALWAEVSALPVAEADAAYVALRDRRAELFALAARRPTRGHGTRGDTIAADHAERDAARAEHAATELRAHLLSRRGAGRGLCERGCSFCASVTA